MKLLIYATVALGGLIFANVSQAQSVTDPGFETPNVTVIPLLGGLDAVSSTDNPNTLDGSPAGSPGWYVSSGTVTVVNQGVIGNLLAGLTNNPSSQYLALNLVSANLLPIAQIGVNGMGQVSQDIATVPNELYQVNYQVAVLGVGVLSSQGFLNAGVKGLTTTSIAGSDLLNVAVGNFQTESFTFQVPTAGTSTIQFSNSGAVLDGLGVAIDNVSITATPVPEPAHTAAIFILGVLAVGMIRRVAQTRLTVASLKSEAI